MDNLNQTAFPFVNQTGSSLEDREIFYGLSKLEYASLVLASGFMAREMPAGQITNLDKVAEISVKLAKIILKLVNKNK
jgi:hypothetical protein